MTVEFAHHGITVTDLAASAEFFREVLGLRPGPRVDLDESLSSGITGIDGAVISAVFLEGPGLTVELLQYHGPELRGTVTTRPCDAGSAHLALYVDDVRRLVDRAAPYGWSPSGDIAPITTGPRAGGSAVYLRDRDGAVLEFVQRPRPPHPENGAQR